jgi:hypothetical protein
VPPSGTAAPTSGVPVIKRWLERSFERVVIAYWRRRDPVTVPGRTFSLAPGDNIQQTMNLVMPLRDTSPVTLAHMANAMSSVQDVLSAGLDNVGTVHFARFDVIGGRLCMISVYDGDFATYIRDFIVTIGAVFDLLLDYVADPIPPRPVEKNIDAFIDWVDEHDLLQFGNVLALGPDLETLPRKVVLLFDACPETQLAVYRSYPGYTVAQIRQALGLGW